MNQDSNSTENKNSLDDQYPQNAPQTVPEHKQTGSNKRLIAIVGSILGLLLLVLIALVIMLMTNEDNAKTDSSSDTDQSAQQEDVDSDEAKTSSSREVLMRVPTTDPKLEYVIFKPQQNGANTTIYFAVENVCEGCDSSTSAFNAVNGFDNRTGSYLVDDNNGKKYSTIKDQDDKVLATTNCSHMVKYGERVECFVAFTKVPSGSTVSWVFGGNRIDNIKVE